MRQVVETNWEIDVDDAQVVAQLVRSSKTAGSLPARSSIEQALNELGVEQAARRLDGLSLDSLIVARGSPPVHGKDGALTLHFERSSPSGLLTQDSSMNYRELGWGFSVKSGQLLVEVRPPTIGEPGRNLLGAVICPRAGSPAAPIRAGKNVRSEIKEGVACFYSNIDGALDNGQTEQLNVQPVLLVDTVGFESGNLDFDGDIVVMGDVLPGFTVKARGSITVGGRVSDQVLIQAAADIRIHGGTVGADTRLRAGRCAYIKFIQHASIVARGDILVQQFLYHARVRCGGRLEVVGQACSSARRGVVLGGVVCAVGGMSLHSVGVATTLTHLIVGKDKIARERINDLEQVLMEKAHMIADLLESLPVDPRALDAAEAISRLSDDCRSRLVQVLTNVRLLTTQHEAGCAELDSLRRQDMGSCSAARVEVLDELHPQVLIEIGNARSSIPATMKHCKFLLDPASGAVVADQDGALDTELVVQ